MTREALSYIHDLRPGTRVVYVDSLGTSHRGWVLAVDTWVQIQWDDLRPARAAYSRWDVGVWIRDYRFYVVDSGVL